MKHYNFTCKICKTLIFSSKSTSLTFISFCFDLTYNLINIYFRCIAIALPLKRMEWMSVKSAKTKIIPFVILFNLTYNSYTVFLLTEADPGIFGCISTGGDPKLVW